jgi:hypothetical protein
MKKFLFLPSYVYVTLVDPATPISPTYVAAGTFQSQCTTGNLASKMQEKEKKRKDSAGSDDTASMIKGRCNHSYSDPTTTPQTKPNTYQTRSAAQ